jgi:hypothetical protein
MRSLTLVFSSRFGNLDFSQWILILEQVCNPSDVLIHNLTHIDIDGSEAVETHYELLLAVVRVINSAILSRGEQNEQTLAEGRKFLSENRLSVLTVFKRSMNIGTTDRVVSAEVINDLADSYMLLITLTGFINVSTSLKKV